MNQRTHVVFPSALVAAIDAMVGKRGRSRFLVDAASREIKRLRQIRALRRAAGSWNPEDHPELGPGASTWVGALRREGDARLRRMGGR